MKAMYAMGVNVVDVDELMLMVVIKNQISYDFINKQRTGGYSMYVLHSIYHLKRYPFCHPPSICTRMV